MVFTSWVYLKNQGLDEISLKQTEPKQGEVNSFFLKEKVFCVEKFKSCEFYEMIQCVTLILAFPPDSLEKPHHYFRLCVSQIGVAGNIIYKRKIPNHHLATYILQKNPPF